MKSIFSSKTFWFAVAQAVVGGVVTLDTAHPVVGVCLILKSVIDVVLRAYTTEPVSVVAQS